MRSPLSLEAERIAQRGTSKSRVGQCGVRARVGEVTEQQLSAAALAVPYPNDLLRRRAVRSRARVEVIGDEQFFCQLDAAFDAKNPVNGPRVSREVAGTVEKTIIAAEVVVPTQRQRGRAEAGEHVRVD